MAFVRGNMMTRRILLTALALWTFLEAAAQPVAWRDTLQAAVKTDTRGLMVSLGHLQTGLEGIRSVVSPMGEGDPIRWAQSLPGVTTGADGTTAMYVRGGGSGNNLFSLDGVPIYGYSHILGLTTIVPSQVMEGAELCKGGFDGGESNFTAAHLRVVTKNPAEKQQFSFALNSFLASADAEGPLGKKWSYIVSARISPLTWEYRAVKGMLPSLLGGMDSFNATVGDAYAKVLYRVNDKSSLAASFLGSQDHYGFNTPDASHEVMGWHNMVGLLNYTRNGNNTITKVTASVNNFGSIQEQEKYFREALNHLSLRSDLTEIGLQAEMRHRIGKMDRLSLSEGINVRHARFSPGQVGKHSKVTWTQLINAWLQAEYQIPDKLVAKASARYNYYGNLSSSNPYHRSKEFKDPELSVSAKWNFVRHLALEVTYDRLVQYYHTLEGLPVGWSLDMIVPSRNDVQPEYSRQGSAGLTGRFGAHNISLGGFYKRMENLIYYKYSQALFNGALSSWEDQVELGNGRSYGLEAMYTFLYAGWYGRLSYTLSKTTREGFPSFYDGQPFHARFDRRHVLNAMVQWKGFTATVILQSGHWENGQSETYAMPFLEDTWMADYYSGVNNYHMPTIFRLDLGWQKSFQAGKLNHTVNLGVCNVTNHFNPFMLYYDTRTESWKEIALLPILPNFSWRIEF